jgi:hypothetical protein
MSISAANGVLAVATDPDGDLPLTAVILIGNGPTQGTLNLQPDGSFTYLPNPGFNGLDVFNFMVRDTRGQFVTRQAKLVIGESRQTRTELLF